jgi:broad specificity phosphatase PhoE
MHNLIFITHPQVIVDPTIPMTEWKLSEEGRMRMEEFSRCDSVGNLAAIYTSVEWKAHECAIILAKRHSLNVVVVSGLEEVDRSAIGYLPPDIFDACVNEFYLKPEESICGRERAVDAQVRIAGAVSNILKLDHSIGDVALISHGGVGCLLFAYLLGAPISRKLQQVSQTGGSYLVIPLHNPKLTCGWHVLEDSCNLLK